MKLTDGNLYFQKKSKIKYQYPYLKENKKYDVAVIGAGSTGAITAYYLAKEGHNVVLVDKNIIGYGSTSSAVSILDCQYTFDSNKISKVDSDKKKRKIMNLCLDSINELEKIIKEIQEKNDIEYKRNDSIYFTNKYMNKSNMIKEYNTMLNNGFNVDFLENHEFLDLKYATLLKNGSAVLNLYEFTQSLVHMLSTYENVDVYENTEIVDIKSNEEGAELITNNRFKIKVDKVIITEGAETYRYFPDMPIDLYRTFNIVTEPIESLNVSDLSFTAKDMEQPCHYMRFTKDKRIILGGAGIKLTEKSNSDEMIKQVANNKYKKLFKTLQEIFYSIDNVVIRYCFNGILAESKDSLPIIDEMPNMPNVYCNLSYGINGPLYAIVGAKMLKEINKEYYARDMHMFKINR